MTTREMFERLAEAGESQEICPHGNTCEHCRNRRLVGEVAREFLDREDYIGKDAAVRCMEEVSRRMSELPGLN